MNFHSSFAITRRRFSAGAGASLFAGSVIPASSQPAETLPSLALALSPYFAFGSAVTPPQMQGSDADFVQRQCAVVVAENAMKPAEMAAAGEGRYDFSTADALVNSAIARGLKVRGHTLVWHNQVPAWMFVENGQTVSRATLIARLQRYVTDVVTHFKGRVFAWDVVNEAFSFGEHDVKTDADGMRLSPWRTLIGPEFLAIAFRAAAAADPDALLFYNDYETQNPRKVAAISKLVRRLKSEGIKIDGIGHQAHYTVTHPPMALFESALIAYGGLGVTQHITELDIALNADLMRNQVSAATPELLALQAARYEAFFRLFIKHRARVSAVLVWGLDDSHTWLKYWPMKRFEAPLLFDDARQPKPAFWAVLKAAQAGL